MRLRSLILANKPLILASLGFASFVISHILTAKGAIKYKEKKDSYNRDISLKEEIKIGVPAYAPAIMAAIISGGLLVAGIHGYSKAYAGAMAAYAAISSKYKAYVAATEKVVNEDELNEIHDILNKDIKRPENVSPASIVICDDFLSEPRYSEITYEEYLNAKITINKELTSFDEVNINVLYLALGFDPLLVHEDFGWNAEYLIATQDGHPWINIDLKEVNGVHKLIFVSEPIMGYRLYDRRY
ncbi:MAG: hypothetical protein J6U54_01695 [Clostridiales bacterium]|nr:hypothetical protein [Clostridiales bacterium]